MIRKQKYLPEEGLIATPIYDHSMINIRTGRLNHDSSETTVLIVQLDRERSETPRGIKYQTVHG